MIVSLASADKIQPLQISLSVVYTGLVVADTALTIYGTSKLGLFEKNNLMAPLFENRRYAAIWTIDAAATGVLLLGCHFLIHYDETPVRVLGYVVLAASILFKANLVIHNIKLHNRVRG